MADDIVPLVDEWKIVVKKDKKARWEKRKHKYTLEVLSNKILKQLHSKQVYMRMNRSLTGVEIHLTKPPKQDSRQILLVIFDLEHFNITPLQDKQWFLEDETRPLTPTLDVDISFWVNRMTSQVVWMRVAREYEFDGLEMYRNIPPQDDREIGVVKFTMTTFQMFIDDESQEFVIINI